MTLDQALAFIIVIGMIALMIWDRYRYDLVALAALLASIACGIVPANKAFTGFSDDVVVIVASALVVSAAVGKSGVVETLVRPLTPYMPTCARQVGVLATAVTALSAFMKNIGALAIFMPIALQLAKRTGHPASYLLMPLSFGSLLGGLMTLIGTSPNIIVSRMREELVGEPFSMFDFTPVGAGIALAGVAFLTFGWRLLPGNRSGPASLDALFEIGNYATEVRLPPGTPYVGKTVHDLEQLGDGGVTVIAIIREKYRRYVPAGHWTLFENDILLIESDAHTLRKIVDLARLELVGGKEIPDANIRPEELGVVEAVVTQGSMLVGNSAEQLALRERYAVNLLALSRRGRRLSQRLRRVRFQVGDLVVLQAPVEGMVETLAALGCLPLAGRDLQFGRRRKVVLPVVILALAMGAVAFQLVPVTIAFFAAAVAVVLSGVLTPKEAYDSVDWSILILLGALIPVSDALRTTGATGLVAEWLAVAAAQMPPVGALGLLLIAAMAVTPFLNNAATVLVMAPIAASLAPKLGLRPDPFLMAVAVGAACDFLTPIGHQCNTLVMGPGGYRFSDYWKLGLPLSILVIALGTPLIALFWPLR